MNPLVFFCGALFGAAALAIYATECSRQRRLALAPVPVTDNPHVVNRLDRYFQQLNGNGGCNFSNN